LLGVCSGFAFACAVLFSFFVFLTLNLAGLLGYSGFVHFGLLFLILRISGFSAFSRISRYDWFLGFSTIFREILVLVAFCSAFSAGSARTKFAGKTRRVKTPLFAHTQTSDHPHFTPQHYTPPSRPTTPYQLRPAPTSRTLHPTDMSSMKNFSTCIPRIFLSEFVRTPEREFALRELEFPILALYQ